MFIPCCGFSVNFRVLNYKGDSRYWQWVFFRRGRTDGANLLHVRAERLQSEEMDLPYADDDGALMTAPTLTLLVLSDAHFDSARTAGG